MQDIHSIGGGRFFAGSGGGGGGDRRLRPHHHLHHHHHHHHHQVAQPQALKCPRCDSANTKFCYYNNYNQSQPRHFCKSCRRYWTKGGVLRNVPVGGGCRKNKRSKQKADSSSVVSAAAAAAQDLKSSNSHSSSESSSLTATTTIANATEAVSAPSDPEPPPPQSKSAANSNPSLFSDPPPAAAPNSLRGSLFPEIGSFTSLMASSSSAAVSGGGVGVGVGTAMHFEFGSISEVYNQLSQSWNNQQNQKDYLSAAIGAVNRDRNDQELKVQEIASAGGLMIDQTAQVDLSALQQDRSNGGGFGSLGDWLQCGDQGLFDLTSTVDQQYWSQNQWNDQDHPGLYLP